MTKVKKPPMKEIVGPLHKGEAPDAMNAEEIKTKFKTNYDHCFFMGIDFTVDISQCGGAPNEFICRAREKSSVEYLMNTLLNITFKNDRQQFVLCLWV